MIEINFNKTLLKGHDKIVYGENKRFLITEKTNKKIKNQKKLKANKAFIGAAIKLASKVSKTPSGNFIVTRAEIVDAINGYYRDGQSDK